jgi:hypothetical protein
LAQVRLVCFFLRRASIGDGFLTLSMSHDHRQRNTRN